MSDEPEETITELFARDPLKYTKQDIDRLIAHYRKSREHFNRTGKAAKTPEKVSLKDLGLL